MSLTCTGFEILTLFAIIFGDHVILTTPSSRFSVIPKLYVVLYIAYQCTKSEVTQIFRNLPILPTTPAFSALVEETPVEFKDDLRLTDGQMDGNQTQDNSIYHAIRARTVKTWSKLRILARPSFLDCVRLNRRSPCNFACNYC